MIRRTSRSTNKHYPPVIIEKYRFWYSDTVTDDFHLIFISSEFSLSSDDVWDSLYFKIVIPFVIPFISPLFPNYVVMCLDVMEIAPLTCAKVG